MTVIAAKFSEDKKKIVIGSDSQTTRGGQKFTPEDSTQVKSKVLKLDNNYAIACAGLVSEISLFQRYCKRTKPKDATEDAIFDFMVDFKDWITNKNNKFEFTSTYIIAYKGKLFNVIYGYQVHEHLDYATGGSGQQCVNVAFALNQDVKTGIEMAIKHDLYCSGEICLIEVEV